MMKKQAALRPVLLLGLILGFNWQVTQVAFAQSPQEKGETIAKLMEAANDNFVGESSKMTMILIDEKGDELERKLEGKVLEVEGDGDRSLLEFQTPQDVKGTKLLTWSHADKDNDQWLYLPSIRRVKRITSSGRSAAFLGSEFSFEDLGGQEREKFKHKLMGEEKKDGHDVWVLERVSKDKSGYSKQVLYVSKKLNNPIQIDYYDRKGELLKTAQFQDYQQFKVGNKEIYRPKSIHMKNAQTKKASIFRWDERKLGEKHRMLEFQQSALK